MKGSFRHYNVPYSTKIQVLRVLAADKSDNVDAALSSYGASTGSTATISRPERVVARLRAHIGIPAGMEKLVEGDRESVAFSLLCEPFDIAATDRIRDLTNNVIYDVTWAVMRMEFPPLSHTVGRLLRTRGVA